MEVVGEVEACLPLRVGGVLDRLRPAHLRPVSPESSLQEGREPRESKVYWSPCCGEHTEDQSGRNCPELAVPCK